MEYQKLSTLQFIGEVRKGNIDLGDFYPRLFKRLQELDKKYGFFVTLAKPPEGFQKKGRLAGVPVSVKDCICTEGLQSTAGSRILEGYVPPFDSTCVRKVKEDGGVVVGKTNQDEFGFGTFSVNSGFGIPRNPLDPTRSCGGSSGGAAGLTAALDLPHIALAESTGGSISCPASFCGVVGLTPTYGLVSRWGLIDYANSLDKIGVIGKGVGDTALMLDVIGGQDNKDFTSVKGKGNYSKSLEGKVKGVRIGIPKEYFGEGVDRDVSRTVMDSIGKLEGARTVEVSLPMTGHVVSAYYIIACSEASTNLAKFCGMRYGKEEAVIGDYNEYFSKVRGRYFGKEAKRRLLLGTFSRMAGYRDKYYLKAMQVRTRIIEDFRQAFRKCDVLIAPTMPVIAPKFSEIEKMGPVQQYMMDILTAGPNLAGIPQLSVPCGKARGMPVGLHVLGDHLEERKVLEVGKAVEGLK